jgi:hypothetical protein
MPSLPELLDVFLLDLGEFACDLGVVVFEGTVGVLHEDVLEVQEDLLLLWLSLYVEGTETPQNCTPDLLLNLLVVIALRRPFAPLPLPLPLLLLCLHNRSVLDLHLALLLQRGLKLS